MLQVKDLDVHLGESHVLQGVSFGVREGGVTALLGRNGVGKTTTMRGLLGLVPRRGSVSLEGVETVALPTHEVVQRGVGYVPEDREVFAGLTVAENLRLAARSGSAHHYDLVYELFPRLRERLAQRAGTMSGGEQQMLALARALLNDNRLLLVDEPSQGLAPHLVTELAEALTKAAELVTILLVEQNLTLVRRLARDAVVLDQGRVVWSGEAAELLGDPDRTRAYLGVGVAH
ncbi:MULTISPECIES: ABC transporter ATP-binding protein [unclassified Spirillospora]|uniref:ABC transporter ATP-binding protein n=1 Tax=unclassified Spirillospora TaxID=2642701 RepID=UPI0037223702